MRKIKQNTFKQIVQGALSGGDKIISKVKQIVPVAINNLKPPYLGALNILL